MVETGNSLLENDLVEIAEILPAETVLIGNASVRDTQAQDVLLRRIDGVLVASRFSLLEYNCPKAEIEAATRIAPPARAGRRARKGNRSINCRSVRDIEG